MRALVKGFSEQKLTENHEKKELDEQDKKRLSQLRVLVHADNLAEFKKLMDNPRYDKLIDVPYQDGFTIVFDALKMAKPSNCKVFEYLVIEKNANLMQKAGKKQQRTVWGFAEKFKNIDLLVTTYIKANYSFDTNNFQQLKNQCERSNLPEFAKKWVINRLNMLLKPVDSIMQSISIVRSTIENKCESLITYFFRFPQMYLSLWQRHLKSPIKRLLLIGPGALVVKNVELKTGYYCFQYYILAALLPDADFIILEPNKKAYDALHLGRFCDPTVFARLFILHTHINKFSDKYKPVINQIKTNMRKYANGVRPISLTTGRVVVNSTLEDVDDSHPEFCDFQIIVATYSCYFSMRNNEKNTDEIWQRLKTFLAKSGDIYLDTDAADILKCIKGNEIKKDWQCAILSPPFAPLSEEKALQAADSEDDKQLVKKFYKYKGTCYKMFNLSQKQLSLLITQQARVYLNDAESKKKLEVFASNKMVRLTR